MKMIFIPFLYKKMSIVLGEVQ